MGWLEWLLVRLRRHAKRILRFYKPEIKKVAVGVLNDGVDDLKNEFYERANPPDFARDNVETFVKYIKEHADTYITVRIDKILEGD